MLKQVVAIVAVGFAYAARAQPAATWPHLDADCIAALRAADWKQALNLSSRIVNEMVDTLGPGDEATKAFAMVVAHKAIAESAPEIRTTRCGTGTPQLASIHDWHKAICLRSAPRVSF